MKIFFTGLLLFSAYIVSAQKVDSMFVHLYTDSLKKGTYNYINVDGLLSNGNWQPLDTNHVEFRSSAGKFYGNQLWVAPDFEGDKITIDAILISDRTQHKKFDMYIKRLENPTVLPTEDDIINTKKKKKKS